MRTAVTILALATVTLIGGCATAGAPADWRLWPRPAAERGHGFVRRACAGCHAVGSQGASPNPDAPPFRTLVARLPGPALDARLAEVSARGHARMPPIYITPAEIRQVAAYIRSLAEPGRNGLVRNSACPPVPGCRGALADRRARTIS